MEDLNRNQQPNRKPGEERAVLVGVLLPDSNADPRDPLGELGSLCQTAGATPVSRIIQNRKAIDPGTYVGSGKALDIAQAAKAFDADFIAFDNELTPGQIGQLEKIINEHLKSPRNAGVKVLDRSEIILDIFANRAQTHEAKLQVELAQMEYTYPRLTKMWGHLERIAGGGTIGVGTRGPGETQLEIDRRLVRNRISDLKAGLQALQERKAREVSKRNDGHFTTCLVGYTNAGKSTLFNTLTAAGALAEDKLFATLDTKTRSWHLERGTDVLLSDTVGFVRDLPHNLVASFKATLEEAVHADVLLHVLDVGHPRARQQYDSVRHVLGEIGAGDNPEILLLNKVDTPEGERQVDEWLALRPDAVAISAKTGRGLEAVHEKVFRLVQGTRSDVRLRVDVRNGKLLSFLERSARINDKSYDGDTVDIHATVGRRTLGDLRRNDDAQILDVAAAK